MNIPVRVVLSNREHDEYELGIFNQGVLFNICMVGKVDVVDVASGEIVCIQTERGWQWGEYGPYEDIFVHGAKKPTVDHPIDFEGELSTRAYNALRRAGFKTLEQVAERSRGYYVTYLHGFGRGCADEVQLALQAIGLDYREEA